MVDTSIYGVDVFLDNGDLAVTNSSDLHPILSLDNLAQAVSNALSTEQGNIFYNLDYGINLLGIVGEKNTLAQQERLRTEISRVLKMEPRIERVEVLTITTNTENPRELDIYIKIKPIESTSSIEVNLVFPFSFFPVTTNSVTSEIQTSTDALTIYTQYSIYNIVGVFLITDTNKTGTNYFTGGFVSDNKITLGTSLPSSNSQVQIDYITLDVLMSNIQITQILNEKALTLDGIVATLAHTIYDVTDAYLASDTAKTGTDYASGSTFDKNILTLGTTTLPNTQINVDYSTVDNI